MSSSQFSFFFKRRFGPLFGTQFAGALNDNLIKASVVVLVSYHALGENFLAPELLVNIVAMLLVIPYFIFSATAGALSAKYNKAQLARYVKVAEIGIMVVAGLGFYLHSLALLLTAILLMGIHSTFFGPIKYAIVPEYLQEKELLAGNGLIETGTFIAILLGQIIGTSMVSGGPFLMIALTFFVAFSGWLFSRKMPDTPPAAPQTHIDWNLIRSSTRILRLSFANKNIRNAILGISWFWLMGIIYTSQLPIFTKAHLGGNEIVFNLILACFSIGIGLGSVICAKLSHGKLQLGLVLFGALGMSLFGFILSYLTHQTYQAGQLMGLADFLATGKHYLVMLCIVLIGFCGGFFSVPLYTWLQTSTTDAFRSNAIAANNIINGLFMAIASALCAIFLIVTHNIAYLYFTTSVLNLIAMVLLMKLAPKIWQARFSWLKKDLEH